MKKLRRKLNEYKANSEVKRYYFLWRNGLNTNMQKFDDMSEKTFLNRYKLSSIQRQNLIDWESTDDYSDLLFMLADTRLSQDLIDVYENVKEMAQGQDSTGSAITSFLKLQSEIRNRNVLKEVDEVEEDEDDELII